MDIYTTAIAVSLCIYILVGNFAGRRVKHLDDYFVAGRQAPTLLILGTLVASVVSTNTFLGDVGMSYRGYWLPNIMALAPVTLGYIFGALFFGRHLRRAGTRTVPEFFGHRFQSRRMRVLAALTVVIGLGGYLMTVNQGAALIISELTAFSYTQALFLVWAGYSVFTIYAGSRGVVLTDTLMFFLFSIVGVASILFLVDAAGGWFTAVERLTHFEPRPGIISAETYTGPGAAWTNTSDAWIWFTITNLAWPIVFAIAPYQSSRYLMAKDEHVVIRSACAAVCVLAIVWPLVWTSGAVIALLNPDIEPAAEAMIWAAKNAMPTLVGAVLLAGIMSAGLSSASTFLSLVGFSISNDIMRGDASDEKTQLRTTRFIVLTVGLLTVAIAMSIPPSIYWIVSFVGPMFAASWGPVAFMSVWSKRITEVGAFWGMLAGILGCFVPQGLITFDLVALPVAMHPILLGAVISLVTIILVSRNGRVTHREQEIREALHRAPPELADPHRSRTTMIWANLLILWGLGSTVAMLFLYVHPFQKASGLLESDGAFLVASPELWLSLVYGALLVAGGLIARWGLRHFLVTRD